MSFKLHSKINEAREDLCGVSLKNCAVKQSRQGENELEVLASSQTRIHNSPKKFKLDEETVKGDVKSKEINELEMLVEVTENQYVCVKGKVVSMFSIQEVSIKISGKKLKKWTYIWQITLLYIDVCVGKAYKNDKRWEELQIRQCNSQNI